MYDTSLLPIIREIFFPFYFPTSSILPVLPFRIWSYHYSLYLCNNYILVDISCHLQDRWKYLQRNHGCQDRFCSTAFASKQTSTCVSLSSRASVRYRRERRAHGTTAAGGHSDAVRSLVSPHATLDNPKWLSLDGNTPAAGHKEFHLQNHGQSMSILTRSNKEDKLHDFRLILKS